MPPARNHRRAGSLVVALSLAVSCLAQPPAQGPPPPRPDDLRSETMAVIINGVYQGIQKAVDSANAKIVRDADRTGVQAQVSYSATVGKPMMTATQNISTPNENQIWIPYIVSYDISGIRYHGIPYFSRKIGQSIDVFIRCHSWYTQTGALTATFALQPAYLDGTSFGEDALNFFIAHTLTDFVDSKLRASLPGAPTTTDTISVQPCACLGVDPGNEGNTYKDGSIQYSLPRHPHIVVNGFNQASVKVQGIKRLQARVNGGIYYQPSEDIRLDVYVNQTLKSAEVKAMKEGDERTLNIQPFTFQAPSGDGTIVVIGNVVQEQGGYETDSQFLVFGQAQNFGNGTQKLVVRKSYWIPAHRLPDGSMTKPMQSFVDAYELSLLVNIPQQVITVH